MTLTNDAWTPSSPTAAPSVGWDLRVGDAWDLSAHIESASIDLVLTSPPYWGLRTYGLDHNEGVLDAWTATGNNPKSAPPYEWYRDNGGVLGLEPYHDWFVAHLVEIFRRIKNAMKPDANLWVNLGDTYFGRWSSIRDEGRQGLGKGERSRRRTPSGGVLHDKQLLMVPARFALAMQEDGWILRNDLVWSKPHVAPRPERDRLRLSHEHFFHFVSRSKVGRPAYYYDLDGVEPGALDVVTASPDRGDSAHSATFPMELVLPRVRSSSPPGGVVLDPFCGTGTTLVAALSEHRRAIGFELSEKFAGIARSRIEEIGILADAEVHS